ncbi:hypothetical protein KP509_31G008200 [Ceratopteris richardii]|uniref:Zinc-ribbon 15 domain-containing protein n=1 Tax=Ceratopteris richardii TaxID=49495 RepID=A0A8T2QVM1_CERRI|nr:hypothetical protein KP509_31G008200 [Ceratopteris richardii]
MASEGAEGVGAERKLMNRRRETREIRVFGIDYIGGVKRREKEIIGGGEGKGAAQCTHCDEGGIADFVKYENVLEVAGVPLWRWVARHPALACRGCGHWQWTSHFEPTPTTHADDDDDDAAAPDGGSLPSAFAPTRHPEKSWNCWSCAILCTPTFKFCPSCGARQNFW